MKGKPPNFIAFGKDHPMWKGGRQKTKSGYIEITLHDYPNTRTRNRILEHRYVMEQYIGRPLKKSEVVHHVNGVKTDNRIENLKIFPSNSAHMIHEVEEGTRNVRKKGKYVDCIVCHKKLWKYDCILKLYDLSYCSEHRSEGRKLVIQKRRQAA